jgi:hypothetical protein
MTASPPLLKAATGVHVTTELASWLDAAATPLGAAGLVEGLKPTGTEPGPSPARFLAFTVTVYDVPLERPVRVHVVAVAPAAVHVAFPGLAVAV